MMNDEMMETISRRHGLLNDDEEVHELMDLYERISSLDPSRIRKHS